MARDGALLAFDRATGMNALIRGPSTRRLRATAPRVVMFGLTNACNLRCGFCSRDAGAANRWDETSAFEILAGLGARGVLEVAFGGGEPLVFRGFDALVARLRRETTLAVHLTTNGVLLDEARLARLRPHLGEVRVSIYDDNPWPARIASLAALEGDFGANVLVTPDRVAALPGLLARLEQLGCPDVALLRYVGPDASLALDDTDLARVAAIARATSMRVRASVCFGESLGLPTLAMETRGDCGAGRDFVVVTSDRTLRACSFAGAARSIETADDVLDAWRAERDRLGAPVSLHGCARVPSSPIELTPDGVRVWRAFSGNNSGDCFLVGKFERSEQATAFVEELREGFAAGQRTSEAWRARFAEAGIPEGPGSHMPETLEAFGPTVIAHTSSAIDDDFPELRALAWKRRGRAIANGVHVHTPLHLFSAIALDDLAALEALEVTAAVDDLGAFLRHGDVLFGVCALNHMWLERSLEPVRAAVAQGGVVSAELVAHDSPPPLAHALAARAPDPDVEWLAAQYDDPERAATFARGFGSDAAVAGGLALVRARSVRARHGFHASRWRGLATVIAGDEVALELELSVWRMKRGKRVDLPIDREALEAELRVALRPDATLEAPATEHWRAVHATIRTKAPLRVLPRLAELAAARGLELRIEARSPRPVEHAIARLHVDVDALRRERRGPR